MASWSLILPRPSSMLLSCSLRSSTCTVRSDDETEEEEEEEQEV